MEGPPTRARRRAGPDGRYELLDVVGAGGFATVWRAHDRLLNRTVALKRPHPAPSESDVHRRFVREARAAARVAHPHLVTVFDAGQDDDGPYLVMEYVAAPSLAGSADAGHDAARVGVEIAEALAVLHEAGIVHRDVTPANILTPAAGAKLTDFGIARASDSDVLTRTGVIHATPRYAAPEVLAGADSSPASDVYSLAVVLSELVDGGRAPGSPVPAPMSEESRWRTVLADALSPDPTDRPTAAELARRMRSMRAQATAAMPARAAAAAPLRRTEALTRDLRAGATEPMPATALAAQPPPKRPRWLWLAFAALAVPVAAIVVARQDDRTAGSENDPATSALPATPTPPATSPPPATSLPAVVTAVATSAAPPSTAPTGSDTVPVTPTVIDVTVPPTDLDTAVAQLLDELASVETTERHRNELDDVGERVEAAIDKAQRGESREAEKEIDDVRRRIERAVERDDRREALELLDQIHALLDL